MSLMDCPVCSKKFDLSKIEEHVEECLSIANDDVKTAHSPKTKRTYPFDDGEKNGPQKKPKVEKDFPRSGGKPENSRNIGFPGSSKNDNSSSRNFSKRFEQTRSPTGFQNEKKNFNSKRKVSAEQGEKNRAGKKGDMGLSRSKNDGTNNLSDKGGRKATDHVPLAEKLRPATMSNYIGQKALLGPETVLGKLLDNGEIPSMILWGPPGCGKTSLANVIAKTTKKNSEIKTSFVKLSATNSGIGDIREAVGEAVEELKKGCRTIVFMDEIHRFNKLQQDIFLPHVEAGTFVLIGATTENPSFSLNSALLSRCRVFVLEKLTKTDVFAIIEKGVASLGGKLCGTKECTDKANAKSSIGDPKFIMDETAAQWLAEACDGDARAALGGLEIAVKSKSPVGKYSKSSRPWQLRIEDLRSGLENKHTLSVRKCDLNYDLISALQKSIAAGDANAALYWLARLMAGGEDPVYIARRLIRVASEDVDFEDVEALDTALQTLHACQMIGMPECDVMLGQCAIYLARASKSRLVDDALRKAQKTISEHKGPQPLVPLHIRDRGGERKLQASLGAGRVNLVRKKETSESRLPAGLENVNFFD